MFSTDEEPIYGEELSLPTVRMSQDQLYSKTQNLTRQLRASDNGKSLKCVGIHPGYQNGFSSTEKQLDVKCKNSLWKVGIVLVISSLAAETIILL